MVKKIFIMNAILTFLATTGCRMQSRSKIVSIKRTEGIGERRDELD
jgi:hypothetical protein